MTLDCSYVGSLYGYVYMYVCMGWQGLGHDPVKLFLRVYTWYACLCSMCLYTKTGAASLLSNAPCTVSVPAIRRDWPDRQTDRQTDR